MSDFLWIAHLFLLCMAASQTESRSIDIDLWTIREDRLPYSTQIAEVGDTIVWHESIKGASDVDQLQHSVTYHPSGDCSEEGKKEIPRDDQGSLVYIFTESDAGKSMFFTSDIGYQCELGMQISVIVNAGQFPVQRSAGDDYISDQIDALSVETTPNPTTNVPTGIPTTSPLTRNPTRTLSPSSFPLPKSTLVPTSSPSSRPTLTPSSFPSARPTLSPSSFPSSSPTLSPSFLPSSRPTLSPSSFPSSRPTPAPTISPTLLSTPIPTPKPTLLLTLIPTPKPTLLPTPIPTPKPTLLPTLRPIVEVTVFQNRAPLLTLPTLTATPTHVPTSRPTSNPALLPTSNPTPLPTPKPTSNPTPLPTPKPTSNPTPLSTPEPTSNPTPLSTPEPTSNPTPLPTPEPTSNPTNPPTPEPASNPTTLPTPKPTLRFTPRQTASPTPLPTFTPTTLPTSSAMFPNSERPNISPTPAPTSTLKPSPSLGRTPVPSPTALATPTAVQSSRPSLEPSVSLTLGRPVVDLDGGAVGREDTTSPTFSPSASPANGTTIINATEALIIDNTVDVFGTFTFSIVVNAGNRDQVPFEAYASQLIVAVDSLALEVVKDLESALRNNLNRHNRRLRILHDWNNAARIGEYQRFLQNLHVDVPGSITQVQTHKFTPIPQVSDVNTFLGGACPSNFGNADEDRCEEITAAIGLFVDDKFVRTEIQHSFQVGLDAGVRSGRLQYFLEETYPQSRVRIVSGEVVQDPKNEEQIPREVNPSMPKDGDFELSREVSAGVVVGTVLALLAAIILAILVCLVTRRRRKKRNMREDSTGCIIDKGSIDAKTLPESSALAWGDQEGSKDQADPDDWSIPRSVSGKPKIVLLSPDLGEYPIPLDDGFTYADTEESQDIRSRDGSVVSDMYSEDWSAITENCSRDGSVVSAKSGRNSSSLGSSSTAGFMSVNRVVDLHGGRFKNYIPGVAEFDDLEAVVLAGDSAAVGATAAALTCQNDESFNENHTIKKWEERSRDLSIRSKTLHDVIDATKAAELDQMIQQGDWAAIIEAAARYESEIKESAILTGDWVNVGATAASLTSQHDGSFNENHTTTSPDEQSTDLSIHSITWQDVIDATKAAELDQMIQQGNWAAIIEVAARYESEIKEGGNCFEKEMKAIENEEKCKSQMRKNAALK